MISFVETKLFTRLVEQYLTDEEYSLLQRELIENPEVGAVIRGSGGFARCGGVWQAAVSGVAGASPTFFEPAEVKCGC